MWPSLFSLSHQSEIISKHFLYSKFNVKWTYLEEKRAAAEEDRADRQLKLTGNSTN
jgi:hypothetical protein